jgi:hypothetical protein
MKLIYGDAAKLAGGFSFFCITTNGDINRHGECVMGRGIALTVKTYYPEAAHQLGQLIKAEGNIVHQFFTTPKGTRLLAFPVKHHWMEEANIDLIARSAHQLMDFLQPGETALLPRPGCGNGRLKWVNVEPILKAILDDRVSVVHWKE